MRELNVQANKEKRMKKGNNRYSFRLTTVSQMLSAVLAILLFVFCQAPQAEARDVAGVQLKEQLNAEGGKTLVLNGAGIRSKFFFKIYVGALYMEMPSANAKEVIGADSGKRIVMHFLYDEVSKEKLVDSWNEGFKNNTSPEQLATLADRINTFNALFDSVQEGDAIVLDYQPQSGTRVSIKGKEKGLIVGKDFNDALLRIWLGDRPVTDDLKKAMLKYRAP